MIAGFSIFLYPLLGCERLRMAEGDISAKGHEQPLLLKHAVQGLEIYMGVRTSAIIPLQWPPISILDRGTARVVECHAVAKEAHR